MRNEKVLLDKIKGKKTIKERVTGNIEYSKQVREARARNAAEKAGKLDVIEPTLPLGGKPKGKYEKPDPIDPRPKELQNEAADLLVSKGYDIEMLPDTKGGNGYGGVIHVLFIFFGWRL